MASVCGICDSEFKSGTVTLPCSKCLKRFCLSCPFPVFKGRQGQKEIAASLASSKHVIFLCLSCVENPAPPPAPVDLAGVEKRIADLTKSVEELKAITPVQAPAEDDTSENDATSSGPLWTTVVRRKAGRPAPSAPPTRLEQTIVSCLAEENHKKSIVIENLPLPSKVDELFQEHEDATSVESMLSDIGLGHLKPCTVYRMSEIDEKKRSPPKVKVIFDDSGVQSKILNSKHLLRRTVTWNNVYIRPSMPKEERQALFNLRVQCRRLLEDLHGPDWKRKLDDNSARTKYGIRDGAIYELQLQPRHNGTAHFSLNGE